MPCESLWGRKGLDWIRVRRKQAFPPVSIHLTLLFGSTVSSSFSSCVWIFTGSAQNHKWIHYLSFQLNCVRPRLNRTSSPTPWRQCRIHPKVTWKILAKFIKNIFLPLRFLRWKIFLLLLFTFSFEYVSSLPKKTFHFFYRVRFTCWRLYEKIEWKNWVWSQIMS